jgi:branched-chain amino acid transport system permease protein
MAKPTPVMIFRMREKKRRYRSASLLLKAGALGIFLLVPFLSSSFQILDLAMNIVIFSVLVASFDILLGYTGILSFAHGLFFGIGAYSVAMLMGKYGSPTFAMLIAGIFLAVAIACALALIISFLSLRVKAIFFAMVTLAIAELAIVLATKLSGFTGGEDGISLNMPGIFSVSSHVGSFMGTPVNGRILTYYLILFSCIALFLAMLRFTHSPMGRVLQAIRDNAQRAEAIGYRTFIFQTTSITFGCMIAAITGGLYAMWVGYVNPESCLGVMTIMLDVLLMVIIGGMGTLYGGIVGAAFLETAQSLLPNLQQLAKSLFPHAVILNQILERWLLLFGALFILVVIFFPKGVIGSLKELTARRAITLSREE